MMSRSRLLWVLLCFPGLTIATTISSVSCTLGGTTETGTGECSLTSRSGDEVSALAAATLIGAPGFVLHTDAWALGSALGSGHSAVAANVMESDTFGGFGTGQLGFMRYQLYTDPAGSGSGNASVTITDGTHVYGLSGCAAEADGGNGCYAGTCPGSGYSACNATGPVPILLGVPITVTTTAEIGTSFNSAMPGFDGSELSVAGATISIFEPDGTPVAVALVPEPRGAGLVFIGIGALGAGYVGRRKIFGA